MKIRFMILMMSVLLPAMSLAQEKLDTVPPMLKGYQGNEGKLFKNHYFNYITLKDESGENQRQATGQYWEINYIYDSVFGQKESFAKYIIEEVQQLGGVLFFSDTSQIHFAIPRDSMPNIWGKVVLRNDRVYGLKMIEEKVFQNKLDLDHPIEPVYDDYVEPVEMPEHLAFLPNTVILSCRYSKFNQYRISFTQNNRNYRQMLMGPYWDLKMEVRNAEGETDKRISTVEIMESYYRAAVKAGGKVIKSKPRELIFYIPERDDKKLYVRVMTAMDGVYYIRAVLQNNADETAPESALDKKDTDK